MDPIPIIALVGSATKFSWEIVVALRQAIRDVRRVDEDYQALAREADGLRRLLVSITTSLNDPVLGLAELHDTKDANKDMWNAIYGFIEDCHDCLQYLSQELASVGKQMQDQNHGLGKQAADSKNVVSQSTRALKLHLHKDDIDRLRSHIQAHHLGLSTSLQMLNIYIARQLPRQMQDSLGRKFSVLGGMIEQLQASLDTQGSPLEATSKRAIRGSSGHPSLYSSRRLKDAAAKLCSDASEISATAKSSIFDGSDRYSIMIEPLSDGTRKEIERWVLLQRGDSARRNQGWSVTTTTTELSSVLPSVKEVATDSMKDCSVQRAASLASDDAERETSRMIQRGNTLFIQERYVEAAPYYEKALEQASSLTFQRRCELNLQQTHLQLAWSYLRAADYSKSQSLLEELTESSKKQAVPFSTAMEANLALSELKMQTGQYDDAESHCRKALRSWETVSGKESQRYKGALRQLLLIHTAKEEIGGALASSDLLPRDWLLRPPKPVLSPKAKLNTRRPTKTRPEHRQPTEPPGFFTPEELKEILFPNVKMEAEQKRAELHGPKRLSCLSVIVSSEASYPLREPRPGTAKSVHPSVDHVYNDMKSPEIQGVNQYAKNNPSEEAFVANGAESSKRKSSASAMARPLSSEELSTLTDACGRLRDACGGLHEATGAQERQTAVKNLRVKSSYRKRHSGQEGFRNFLSELEAAKVGRERGSDRTASNCQPASMRGRPLPGMASESRLPLSIAGDTGDTFKIVCDGPSGPGSPRYHTALRALSVGEEAAIRSRCSLPFKSDIPFSRLLISAIRTGDRWLIRMLRPAVDLDKPMGATDHTALIYAVLLDARKAEAMIPFLLGLGADVNAPDARGHSPLMVAISTDLYTKPRLLLRLGADPAYRSPSGESAASFAFKHGREDALPVPLLWPSIDQLCDAQGRTWLHYAASAPADLARLRRLLRKGYPFDVRDRRGMTPLMLAAQADNVDGLVGLLDAGATLDACDARGRTALMVALDARRSAAAWALVSWASVKKLFHYPLVDRLGLRYTDRDGRTALTIAETQCEQRLAERLFGLSHSAVVSTAAWRSPVTTVAMDASAAQRIGHIYRRQQSIELCA